MQPHPILRDLIATVVIATVVALWARAQILSAPMGTLWELVMLILVVASGYAIFGHRIMGQAVDDAQELQGQTDDDSDSADN